jgi:catechol 2,3-dioxygenase-like lactoylglutathione lyase family enzyme
MAHGLHHVHIKSRDPWSSAEWWVDMFGAKRLPEIEFGTMIFVPVELDGVRLNITNPAPGEEDHIDDPPAIPYYGLEHLGILTEDLDSDLERFREQGLKIYDRRPGAGGYEIAFVATPDDVVLELMQAPR